jgi:uncharacterized protein (DUF433 family)
MDDWRKRISVNSEICGGRACITGTRVPVAIILSNLAEGLSPEAIVDEYPTVTVEDVRAAIHYAAEISNEQIIVVPSDAAE